jgi:hypothetical protein
MAFYQPVERECTNAMSNRISRYAAAALVIGVSDNPPLRAQQQGYESRPHAAQTQSRPAQNQGRSESGDIREIFDAHNRWRQQWGVPPLQWNSALAERAQNYATHLASTGTFEHGDTAGVGQNLWEGTSGYYSGTQMIEDWGSEANWYHDGSFPNVSTTGDWRKGGHFTQLIWRNTREVGCGLSRGGGNDVLVCDYYPSGNWDGQGVR